VWCPRKVQKVMSEISFKGVENDLLYELDSFSPPWLSYEQERNDSRFQLRFWSNAIMRSAGLASRIADVNAPSTMILRSVTARAPDIRALFQVSVSPDGQFAASIEADSLVVRRTSDKSVLLRRRLLFSSSNTASDAPTNALNSDSLPASDHDKLRWRRLVWTRDSLQLVVLSGDGDVVVLSAQDGSLVARASALELGCVDGFADISTSRARTCECLPDSSDSQCNEILLLTNDGYVRRVHIPVKRSDADDAAATIASLHPLVGAFPGDKARDACASLTAPIALFEWQFLSTCLAFDAVCSCGLIENARVCVTCFVLQTHGLVAVGGGDRDAARSSLALWRINDTDANAPV
jgi:hypothetical protein